jgi:hypothetical protein
LVNGRVIEKCAYTESQAKKWGQAGCQWLRPVIKATWEAEIGKIKV